MNLCKLIMEVKYKVLINYFVGFDKKYKLNEDLKRLIGYLKGIFILINTFINGSEKCILSLQSIKKPIT